MKHAKNSSKHMKRNLNHTRRSRSKRANYYGVLDGIDSSAIRLDDNISRARNVGFGNWNGNAAEENKMRKELNTLIVSNEKNTENDEPFILAKMLATLQVKRDLASSSEKKSIVDDTEDIEDDIYYHFTKEDYDTFSQPKSDLVKAIISVFEKVKTELRGKLAYTVDETGAKEFCKYIVKQADAASFFSSKKPRGETVRSLEDKSRSVKKGVRDGAKAIVSKAKEIGSSVAAAAKAVASGIVNAVGDGCPLGSEIDYDYSSVLNPKSQQEKNCFSKCDLSEVNDGMYCIAGKADRLGLDPTKNKHVYTGKDPEKLDRYEYYNKKDQDWKGTPRRRRKLILDRESIK